ncbi:MAG: DMT family transporter [Gammaproteobacteria bacterium]|nr:DMT family transporter [Gammaproteobacteria bacterium]
MSHKSQNNINGIGLMLVAMMLFPLMDAVAKWLVIANVPSIQVIAIRGWMMVTMILLFYLVCGKVAELVPKQPLAHVGRGVLGFLAPYCFFTALKQLPLADATVVFFSSTFILTAMSALLLKEQVGLHRWSAVFIGFVGVVIAMNPQGGGELSAYTLVLISALTYAFLFLSGSYLAKQDSVISLVFSTNLMMTVVATGLLSWVWVSISWAVLGMLLLMTVIALAAHITVTMAFSRAQVSALAPFEYTALVWAAIFGYLIWGDFPALQMCIGATIIIGSGLYVIHREALHHKTLK